MTWNEYTTALIPLIKKFGKHKYSDNDIQNGFKTWRTRQQIALIDEINQSIGSNQLLVLAEAEIKPIKHKVYRHIESNPTEGELERFLAINCASNLWDLVLKKKC